LTLQTPEKFHLYAICLPSILKMVDTALKTSLSVPDKKRNSDLLNNFFEI